MPFVHFYIIFYSSIVFDKTVDVAVTLISSNLLSTLLASCIWFITKSFASSKRIVVFFISLITSFESSFLIFNFLDDLTHIGFYLVNEEEINSILLDVFLLRLIPSLIKSVLSFVDVKVVSISFSSFFNLFTFE